MGKNSDHAALSDVLLQEVLGAAAAVRVRAWTPRPAAEPRRSLRLEQTPEAGRDAVVVLELWPDPSDPDGCVGAVGEQAGRLPASSCRRLQQDLLHTDPVHFWLETARSIEVTVDGHTSRFERTPEGLLSESPDAEADIGRLRDLAQRRVATLEASGEAPRGWTLRVLPKRGERLTATAGEDVIAIDGLDWRYRLEP